MALTMKDGWGFRFNDESYKSVRDLLRHLVEAASMGGNLLLNVSPDGNGVIPPEDSDRLKQIGTWLKTHGDSIFGTKPVEKNVRFYGPMTHSGRTLYLHLLMEPREQVIVRGVPVKRIKRVSLMASGQDLAFTGMVEVHLESKKGGDALGELRIVAPERTDPLIDVIAVEFDGDLFN
jgi:alpha-L-fucosidase